MCTRKLSLKQNLLLKTLINTLFRLLQTWQKITSTRSFNKYIKKPGNEFKDAFFSLRINKSAGYDDISFSVVKSILGFYINLCCSYLIFLYKLVFFQINSRLLGLHHCLKVVKTMNSETADLYLYYHGSQKFWKKLCKMIVFMTLSYRQ